LLTTTQDGGCCLYHGRLGVSPQVGVCGLRRHILEAQKMTIENCCELGYAEGEKLSGRIGQVCGHDAIMKLVEDSGAAELVYPRAHFDNYLDDLLWPYLIHLTVSIPATRNQMKHTRLPRGIH